MILGDDKKNEGQSQGNFYRGYFIHNMLTKCNFGIKSLTIYSGVLKFGLDLTFLLLMHIYAFIF